MNEHKNDKPTVADTSSEKIAFEAFTEWQMQPEQRQAAKPIRWTDSATNISDLGALYIQTTDLDSGNDARERGAAFGFDDIQIIDFREGLPSGDSGLIVSMDELLLDARQRREYLAWLKEQTLQLPTIVVGRDFDLGPPTVVRPGLLLSCRLDDAIFRALRDGHIDLPAAETEVKNTRLPELNNHRHKGGPLATACD